MFPNGQNSCLKKHLHLQTSIMSKHILQISLNFALSSCQQQKNTTECFLSNWSTLDQSGSLQKTLRILLEKNKLNNLIEKTWKNRKQMNNTHPNSSPHHPKSNPSKTHLGLVRRQLPPAFCRLFHLGSAKGHHLKNHKLQQEWNPPAN